jgi:Protein of unknown function (DUF3071)
VRPVRFVALSEDGQALILTDEVGRMLSLAIDEVVIQAVSREQGGTQGHVSIEVEASLTPRDIQARIRAGDSPEEVARVANVPMEKVLRFAGPVLQERAAIAQLARRTRLRTAENGASLGEVADDRFGTHNVDPQAVSWDAYRRDDGCWRVTAAWPSGKATAHALWDLDKAKSVVTPADEMAQFLSAEKQTELLAQEEPLPPIPPRIAAANNFDEDDDESTQEDIDGPTIPSLSVLRHRDMRQQKQPQQKPQPEAEPEQRPRERRAELPSWDDILFGARHRPN